RWLGPPTTMTKKSRSSHTHLFDTGGLSRCLCSSIHPLRFSGEVRVLIPVSVRRVGFPALIRRRSPSLVGRNSARNPDDPPRSPCETGVQARDAAPEAYGRVRPVPRP